MKKKIETMILEMKKYIRNRKKIIKQYPDDPEVKYLEGFVDACECSLEKLYLIKEYSQLKKQKIYRFKEYGHHKFWKGIYQRRYLDDSFRYWVYVFKSLDGFTTYTTRANHTIIEGGAK